MPQTAEKLIYQKQAKWSLDSIHHKHMCQWWIISFIALWKNSSLSIPSSLDTNQYIVQYSTSSFGENTRKEFQLPFGTCCMVLCLCLGFTVSFSYVITHSDPQMVWNATAPLTHSLQLSIWDEVLAALKSMTKLPFDFNGARMLPWFIISVVNNGVHIVCW